MLPSCMEVKMTRRQDPQVVGCLLPNLCLLLLLLFPAPTLVASLELKRRRMTTFWQMLMEETAEANGAVPCQKLMH